MMDDYSNITVLWLKKLNNNKKYLGVFSNVISIMMMAKEKI